MHKDRGNCLKYLERGWNRKDFKKEGQAESRGGCFKKGGGWNPLTNYGSILGPTYLLPSINDLNVICNITINADDANFYSKCEQVSDLWQKLELAYELEFDLQNTIDWNREWFVNFSGLMRRGWGVGIEPPIKFSKRGVLTGPQL